MVVGGCPRRVKANWSWNKEKGKLRCWVSLMPVFRPWLEPKAHFSSKKSVETLLEFSPGMPAGWALNRDGGFPARLFLMGPGVGVLCMCFDTEGVEGEESFFKAGVVSAGESSFFLF
jgi:hypothetical protein